MILLFTASGCSIEMNDGRVEMYLELGGQERGRR